MTDTGRAGRMRVERRLLIDVVRRIATGDLALTSAP